jgi:hypothetical protein
MHLIWVNQNDPVLWGNMLSSIVKKALCALVNFTNAILFVNMLRKIFVAYSWRLTTVNPLSRRHKNNLQFLSTV